MAEYIDTRINPADYIEVWEVEDSEHGKQLVMAVDDLKCLPPADVRPVIRGRWINEERVGFGSVEAECSNCGRRMIYNPAWICCPWCMADMRGGDAE